MTILRCPVLIVFSGLPGTGKTTVSQALAKRLNATYLRIDVVEQALIAAGIGEIGATGYGVANALAESNLRLGGTVIADCVNPVSESRNGWRETAARSSAQLIEVEIICSDVAEHRRRVESRLADIPDHTVPRWEAVMQHEFEPWIGDRLILDTAIIPLADAVQRVEEYVLEHSPGG